MASSFHNPASDVLCASSLMSVITQSHVKSYTANVKLATIIMTTMRNGCGQHIFCPVVSIFMVTLWNMADHYIFALWFLLLSFSAPTLSHRRLNVCHTSTHGVALVRI